MVNLIIKEFKENRIKSIFIVLLIGCAICEFATTIYFTIFEAVNHMGIDSSWEYLKVLIADRENRIFPITAVSGTTHPEFERLIGILPLYKLTGNLYLSYAITNAIITGISIYLIVRIAKRLRYSITTILIIINLFLCPFLSNGYTVQNELGYYECVNGFAAYYNILVVTFLCILYFFLLDEDVKRQNIIGVITAILTVYISFNKGLGILMWVGLPILAYIAIEIFAKNSFMVLKERKNLFLLGFIIAIFMGRFLGGLYGLSYFDGETRWVTIAELFKVIGNTIIGFAYLLGGVPAPGALRSPTSFAGFVYCFGIVISVCFYIAVIRTIINTSKEIKRDISHCMEPLEIIKGHSWNIFILIIVGMTVVVFSLISPYMVIGDTPNERYLIFAVLAGFFLLGDFIESIDKELIIKKVGLVILFFSIVMMDLYSIYFIKTSDNSALKVSELLEVIDQKDAEIVYFWDNGKTLLEPEKILRVVDNTRVYKCISNGNELETFGDYTYYDDSTEYTGPTILIMAKDDLAAPKEIVQKYNLVTNIDNYSIYYCNENPISLKDMVSNL